MLMPIPEMDERKQDNPKMLAAATVEGIAILKNYKQDKLEMYERMRKFIEHVRRLSVKDIKRLLKRIDECPEVQQLKYK